MDAVILDLDMTLIDSSSAESARRSGQWQSVYSMIPGFTVYPGVHDLLHWLGETKVPVCIVTSSPGTYCDKVTRHHGLVVSTRVCYHDTTNHKPHPAPYLKALDLLGVAPSRRVLACGDAAADVIAGQKSNISTVGCLWGALKREELIGSNPNYLCRSVADLARVMKSW